MPRQITRFTIRILDSLYSLLPKHKSEAQHLVTGRHGEEEAYFYLREHGYVIVEGFLDEDELKGGREDLYRIFPTAEQYAADPSAYPAIERPAHGNQEFPYAEGPALNRNTTVPELLSFVERALGTDDILLTQSLIWSKYGEGGDGHDQALHFDYVDNSLVVPSDDTEVISVTPAISPSRRSSGAATVAAMVAGSAPGLLADTRMVGSSKLGRLATGRNP